MLELPLLADRAARRVYQTLAWLHARRPATDRQALRDLRTQAFRLGLRADAARDLEVEARAARSIRVGRDPEERAWLEACLADMTRRDPALAPRAAELLRRATRKAGETPPPGRVPRCPFEPSEEASRIPLIVPQRVAPRQAG